MTDKPSTLVNFTEAEKAFIASGGQGNPYPDEKVEESDEPVSEGVQGRPDGKPENDKPASAEGKQGDQEGGPEAEDGDEEVTEVADGTNPDGQVRRKVIAFSAYDKQRHRANKLAEEATKLREQVAYLSGLSQTATKPQAQAQQPQTEELSLTPPDKAKEPEKYLAWLENGMARLLKAQQAQGQQAEQNNQFSQINQAVYDHEQAFINGDQAAGVEAHPDFGDAVKYLQDRHRAELKTAGYDANEIQQIMAARAQSVALKALQAGKSPAERVYELAKLAGYKKAPAPKQETEAEKIARQAEKQAKAGKTISGMPGGGGGGELTAEALANMDPVEFQKAWDAGKVQHVLSGGHKSVWGN